MLRTDLLVGKDYRRGENGANTASWNPDRMVFRVGAGIEQTGSEGLKQTDRTHGDDHRIGFDRIHIACGIGKIRLNAGSRADSGDVHAGRRAHRLIPGDAVFSL